MKILKTLMVLGLILFTNEIFGQNLPASYQPILNEIVTNFETIRGSNSITQGKNKLSVLDKDKIALRVEFKNRDKNLTFIKKTDEESQLNWFAANELTTDMVNKHEDFLTKTLESMLKLSQKKASE